jgi:large subunit ribosomal protein L22
MGYVAKHRFAPISPRKARLVLDLIRGKRLNDALAAVDFCPKRAAGLVGKVLKSAQAGALEAGESSLGNLVVKTAVADEGPVRRKWRARARGMASTIRKRTSHITIELETLQALEAAAASTVTGAKE